MKRLVLFVVIGAGIGSLFSADLPEPMVIKLDIPPPQNGEDSTGGILVADVDGDAEPDFLVTTHKHLAVYKNDGTRLWIAKTDIVVGGQSESKGLPGHHGPGVAVGDTDGDGKPEVIFLTRDGVLHVVDGSSGDEELTSRPPVPEGAERWELAMVADFHGAGDRDLLLQATNLKGYRMGKYLAAYRFDDLKGGNAKPVPIWQTDQFVSCAHNGARLADLDGDGRDEVLGATIFSHDGREIARAAKFRGHMDSVFVADVMKERAGLEVVLLEEGSDSVQVLAKDGPVWRSDFKQQEPQNAAVGRFKKGSREVFVWCRSRYNENQTPFVFDADGKVVADYKLSDVAPESWSPRGVEIIHTIDWDGSERQLACAKERHTSGDVCVFDPMSGKFVAHIEEKADRLYVADVFGDWREEIIVQNRNELHIYQNAAPNPRPGQPSLWQNRNYRRLKQCHNYYSP